MGRSVTPASRVEVIDASGYRWATPFPFRATTKNLIEWAHTFNHSVTEGVNKHLGAESLIASAKIISQRGSTRGQVLAEVTL